MKKVFTVVAVLGLLCLCLAAQAVVMETVTIGGAGNAADTTGYGAVGYGYNIGKYEVTAGQYTEFLNAKAATDTYGLYNSSMLNDSYWGCQIQRTGSSGSYTYSVASGNANRPVNYVCWYDTVRFANWLTNGQGNGDTESGSYVITGGGVNCGTVTIATHTPGTTPKWFLTSEDEWYKAAYYKNGVYYQYANGTNTAPSATDSNYGMAANCTWDGSLNGALEQNGTKDMMGNVWEWNEALRNGSLRVLRGGAFWTGSIFVPASYRNGNQPNMEYYETGFRVSETVPVPEPSSLIALAAGLLSLAGIRRRRA
jgi:formylglycine-generating enzyme